MNILISGANGYIGSAVVEYLLRQPVRVFTTTRREDHALPFDLAANFIQDITEPFRITINDPIDVFVHLAAANDVDSKDPYKAMNVTVMGTRNALEFCKEKKIKKFIYFSTFQVYGKVEGSMDEGTIAAPNNEYGISHLFAEEYVKMYCKNVDMDYVILRPTNIFGAPATPAVDRWSLVPNCFCKEAFETGNITLLTSGKQVRDFINLGDLPVLLYNALSNFKNVKNKTVNVFSGNKFSMIEIAGIVNELYEQKYGKACTITVRSDEPLRPNNFEISSFYLDKLGVTFKNKESIRTEIEKIFNLLKK